MPNFRGSPRVMRAVLALGTGAVATQTKLLGFAEVAGRIKAVRYGGLSAVTGTSITADVQKLTADGVTATSVQSAATDVKLTAATDNTAVAAALLGAQAYVTKGQLLQVVVTANAITVGPGDLVVEVEIEPRG